MTEYTPTVTLTYTSTPTGTPSVTSTNTITSTVTITMTAEDTKTATVSPTVTITATSTNTALPGTVWTRAVEHAEFSERRDFGSIEFNGGDGNKMWVIGGTGSEYFNDAYNSTDGITWQQVTQTTPFTARAKHITLFYQSKLWLICGEDGLNKSDIWYSSNGADWTRASTMTALARWTDSAGAVFNPGGEDKMYVAGGFKDGLYQSSVYSSTDGVNWIMLAGSAGFAPRAGAYLQLLMVNYG